MSIDRLPAGFGGQFVRGPLDRRCGPIGLLLLWTNRIRQRRALADLDGALRRDVGLTTAQVDREIAKPFWRA
ncbi:MAG: DUF1127 domain-containing protein [Rhodospirillales bacterium]|nr:DUF1127 domain-containing protein [Rhodospirillales bacterium]